MAVLCFNRKRSTNKASKQEGKLHSSQFETILLSLNARINKGDFWKKQKIKILILGS